MLTLLCPVQLEDDIVARPNFFTTMKNFALQQPLEDWMILEFSQLGFIGWYHRSGHECLALDLRQRVGLSAGSRVPFGPVRSSRRTPTVTRATRRSSGGLGWRPEGGGA